LNPGFVIRETLLPLAWALHVVALAAFAIACWVVLRWVTDGFERGTDLAIVAMASICAHVPMLFLFSTHFRYAMLAWDLNLIVLAVWTARAWRARAERRWVSIAGVQAATGS